MSDTMKVLPAIALRGLCVMPGMVLHFDISRDRSIKAVEAAMANDQYVFLVTQQNPDDSNPGLASLYKVGVTAKIRSIAKLPKDIVRVMAEGVDKCRLLAMEEENGYLKATVETEEEPEPILDNLTELGMIRALEDLLKRYGQMNQKFGKESLRQLLEMKDLKKLTMAACAQVVLPVKVRQLLLEANDLMERYEGICAAIAKEIQIIEVQNEIQQKLKERIDKNQRDYILREQIKLIQEELGEDPIQAEIQKFQEATDKLQAPEEVKERIRKETGRLKTLGNNNAEASVVRAYIENLLEMPWDKATVDNEDIRNAARILDEDHYGLEKVKERVLEFLAVRTMTKKGDSPILCLAGPPGTGKTSIARSIARALEKEYVRISLGGVRDEAEIRGHRKTYIGAMPGRIAEAMKHAGVRNPLMLLDEIDKVSSDYKGDTSAALLEVLDSEQNCKFRDHYVELPIDLSDVLFIATANDLSTVPRPLLDRMEVIELSSYTATEKYHIAVKHLLPKQLERHGLQKKQLNITKAAMQSVIDNYTREAGVRQLERKIGEICRKAVKEILETQTDSVKVTGKNIEKYLGRKQHTRMKKNAEHAVGIVRGLAWTSVGGDTLQIEVNTMPGKGEILLTGQLGDVMKESARTALSYVRSISEEYEIPADYFSSHEIHLHIPEGAVPKDGPSAGITMATGILSAITGIPVRADVAMTGEITLRGRVLPIGGLKEKMLAAKQAGILTVLVPSENRALVDEIPEEIKDGMQVIYVSTMKEVLANALVHS